ncbi:MAG: glycerophosphodiester phosphodiesterase family protein [Christensenellales bacterium]
MDEKFWFKDYLIAHRGFHTEDCPENTLPAFQKAIELGFAIELDVQQIADGSIIVYHDNKLERLTGKDGYAKNLKKEDLSSCHILGTENTIPLFSEVLNLINGQVPVLIEIKNDYKVGEPEKAILEILKDYKGKFAIQSFNPYVVQFIKKKAPNIIVGQLSSFFKDTKLGFVKKFILKRLKFIKEFKADFISYDALYLPNKYVSKHSDLPLLAWTIRSQEEFERLEPICDSIIFENFTPKLDK